jgi:hypothetical protein
MRYIKKFENIDWNYIDEEKPDIMFEFEGNEDFYNFLVDNDALDKFIDNYNKYKFKWNKNLKDFLEKTSKEDFIESSFKWLSASEGSYYWSKLNDKWIINA